jgi:hypothetical protein
MIIRDNFRQVIHSWEILPITCWDISPWRDTYIPWRRSRRFSLTTLRIWLWIYPLGNLCRLDLAPLTRLLPYFMGTSHSLGNIFFGGFYMWLECFIILCIVE